ncbi:hypothetical protein I4U23_018745 [Adineta vaga]|nr:hypothetical protein I4U23_018745 [Adineta vaga]
MSTVSIFDGDKSLEHVLPLNNYLSFHRIENHQINYLNLNRCLRQPYVIDPISNPETIEGISLKKNFLIQMPTFVSDYTNLIDLNVSHNELHKILRLSKNQIELFSNDCIHLKHLIQLDLDHNQIVHFPHEFFQCPNLQKFNISSNPIRKLPEILFQLRSLNQLIFNNSNLNDLISNNHFQKYFFRTLNRLDLSNNNLHTNLHQLTSLKALTYLDLTGNHLNELDRNFRTMTCLKILKLSKNKFENFPIWLYEMDESTNQRYIGETLLELYIHDNQIELIPDEIIHMTSLQTLDLSNNKFARFPDPLIYLDQLTCLIYSQKHGIYIDKIPDDFLHLYNLRKLDFSHNIFNEIPQCIYSLTKLEYLDMSYNLLTAVETDHLKQLKHLKMINLIGNQFASFPSILYQIESIRINENNLCLAPPNDFLEEKYISAASNLFVQINDQYENELFRIYKQILIEYLPNYDIERLLIRLKLSENDINKFRKNYHHYAKREEKIEILLHIWKQKRGSLANSETLYKLAQLIGDKTLLQHFQKAYLLARKIRI